MKLEKRNARIWKLYLDYLAAADVISSGTCWHGDNWSGATAGERHEASQRKAALARRLRAELKLLPLSEIASWDVYPELLRLKIIDPPEQSE